MQNRSGVNLWVKRSLFCQLWEDVSYLYTPAADTHLLHSLPAGAVYFGLFYRYIVRTQAECHVIRLTGTIVAVIIYSAVNSCSDII